jgi:parvulin-like peptidyl-prolyl isomerase
MTWRRIFGSAVVAPLFALGGCESSPTTLARNQFLQDPGMMAAIARNGNPGPDVSRGQKPETRTASSSLLDQPPERPPDLGTSPPVATIRAVVNAVAILDEEVRSSAYGELMRAGYLPEPERTRRTAEVYSAALNRIIEREIVLQDAFKRLHERGGKDGDRFVRKLTDAAHEEFDKQVMKGVKKANHFKTDEEVKRYFAEMGISLASVRRQWERNFMEFEYLRNRIFPLLETRVNHQMIVDYYDKHPEEFTVNESVKWQDLFVSTAKHGTRDEARAFAESLADQARHGSDFATLVKDNDDGDSSLRDGEGVGTKRGEIRPAEAEAALLKMTDGQVGALIELPTGFHVVKLVRHQVAGLLPFDQKVQKEIRDKLRGKVFEDEKKKIVDELTRQATVVIARKAAAN